jgi:hypothetical protein
MNLAKAFGLSFAPCVALAFAAGCSASVVQPILPPIPAGMTAACVNGALLYAAGIKPAPNASFVGFRVESTSPKFDNSMTTVRSVSFTNDVSGTICGDSADLAACTARLDALTVLGTDCQGQKIVPKALSPLGDSEAAAFPSGDVAGAPAAPLPTGTCSSQYLAYTRGEEVAAVRTLPEALAFFGAIDSPQEAMYIALLNGESMSCAGSAPAAYRATAKGYEVQSSNVDRCGNTISRRIVLVALDGTVTLLSNVVVNTSGNNGRCY